jgi:transposase
MTSTRSRPNRTADRCNRRRRVKTDIEDAEEAMARDTLADPQLPLAGEQRTRNPAWDTLPTTRDWRGSPVLQRVRLLAEAEAVLVTLPVTIRDTLPSTSRVLPQLKALAEPGAHEHAELAPADRMKLDRLRSTLDDVLTLTKRIKELDTRTEICGIGGATAMELLAEVGDPLRFTTEAQFARWCGTAPVAVSSGEGRGPARRHHLDLGGQPGRELGAAHRARHPDPLP